MQITENEFKDDALNRVTFVTNISKFISGLDTGVVAIDGEWGSGKTWVGKRIRGLLDTGTQCQTVWVDTFDGDWSDDPVLTLLAAFAEQLPTDKRAAFVDAVAPLAGKIVTSILKASVLAAGNLIGVDKDVVAELSGAAKDAGDELVKRKLNDLADRKETLKAIQSLLAESVEESPGKVVVFVDELDRCTPAFAIRFLERIKHLFAINNVVFVLLWNRIQIQQAVKTFYGQGTDGQMYLDRFVDYPCHLPNHHLIERVEAMGLLVEKEIQKLTGSKRMLLESHAQLIGTFADLLGMTAREVIRVCSWWVMSPSKGHKVLEVWLLCIKEKRRDIYSALRTESADAHKELTHIVARSRAAQGNGLQPIVDALQAFHLTCSTGDSKHFDAHTHVLFDAGYAGTLAITSQTILRIESVIP